MNDFSLTKRSDSLYQKSQKLLSVFDFVGFARKYFKNASLVGSAASNLMVDADIDIDCQVENIDKHVILKFIDELFGYKECKKIILYNHILDEKPFFIVNIEKFDFEEERWIITFFISGNLNDTANFLKWVKENLNEKRRETILMLKKYREDNKQKRSIPSHLIYKAVIEENITSIEDFKNYLSRNCIDPGKQDEY